TLAAAGCAMFAPWECASRALVRLLAARAISAAQASLYILFLSSSMAPACKFRQEGRHGKRSDAQLERKKETKGRVEQEEEGRACRFALCSGPGPNSDQERAVREERLTASTRHHPTTGASLAAHRC